MGDFFQNGTIATLHDFGSRTTAELEAGLKLFSAYRPMEIILPSLFSELEGDALPNIVEQIACTDYLNHVIIGLDRADRDQYEYAFEFFTRLKQPFSILWNDGPRLKAIQHELEDKGLGPTEAGKGRNVWYCIGMSIARNSARSVALHDCDIKTYDRRMLAKLFYPVVNPLFNFEFCKGFYPRVADNKMNGRVARLLVFPLLNALEKTIGKSEYLDFMKSFKYPLAGEFSFRRNILPELRISSDWGIEIGILSEMQRNFSPQNICQVDLADTYDHKHQDLSTDDENKGLSRMSIDIIKTFIKKLATQGHSFSREQLRSLKATYYRSALDLIDAYRGDAEMNGLKFDSHSEEKAVELFSKNIIKAGEDFYLNPMDAPFIPTWSRVKSAIPDFLIRLEKAVNEDNKFYL